ncbi:MAG: LysM peptidoglycan-binding domain-containing protein, partial [Planctomycetota bacterium]
MREDLTRRQILFAGAGLLIAGCAPRRDTGPLRPPPSLPVSPAVEVDPPLRYVIRKGDTLSSLSRRSGLSVAAIVDANHLRSSLIKPGQVLLLPGAEILSDDPLAARLLTTEDDHRVRARGYALIPRRAWTRNRVRSNHRPMNGVKRITVHHTGEHKGMVGKSDRQIVKAIENHHRNGRKWSAIGYHYLIGRDHRVYEGRPTHIQGAHVSSHNAHNIG